MEKSNKSNNNKPYDLSKLVDQCYNQVCAEKEVELTTDNIQNYFKKYNEETDDTSSISSHPYSKKKICDTDSSTSRSSNNICKTETKEQCKCGGHGPIGPTGPTGPKGPTGSNGLKGPRGPAGPAGSDGPRGLPGLEGPEGQRGKRGYPGPTGPRGSRGEQGERGPIGKTGRPGCQGPPGQTGKTGRPGKTGIRGPQGQSGMPGPKGMMGIKGETGDQGPIGPTGPPGPQGPQGPEGPPGPEGLCGPEGPLGPMGREGPQGLKGDKGDPGNRGPAGPMGLAGSPTEKGDTGVLVSSYANNVIIPKDKLSFEFDERCFKIWGKVVKDPLPRDVPGKDDLFEILPLDIDVPDDIIGDIDYDSTAGVTCLQTICKENITNFTKDFSEENWVLQGSGSYHMTDTELNICGYSAETSFKTTIYVRIPKNGVFKADWSMVSGHNVTFMRFDYIINNNEAVMMSLNDGAGKCEINVKESDILYFELSITKNSDNHSGVNVYLNNLNFVATYAQSTSICGCAMVYNDDCSCKDKIRLQVGPTQIEEPNVVKYIYSFNMNGLFNIDQ